MGTSQLFLGSVRSKKPVSSVQLSFSVWSQRLDTFSLPQPGAHMILFLVHGPVRFGYKQIRFGSILVSGSDRLHL